MGDSDYVPRTGRTRVEPGKTTKEIASRWPATGRWRRTSCSTSSSGAPKMATIGDAHGVAIVKNTDLAAPPERTKPEVQLIAKIAELAETHDLTVPDTTYTPGAELKGIFVNLKAEAKQWRTSRRSGRWRRRSNSR